MLNNKRQAGTNAQPNTNDELTTSAPLAASPMLAAALSVNTKKILITWYNSLDKANIFCQWVSKNYKHRKATIEKDADTDCHWIYMHVKENDASPFQMVVIVQSAIQDNPTLAKH